MEYHSPLGYNFKLSESVSKQEEKKNAESSGNPLPSFISLNSEGSSRKQYPNDNQKQGKRNSFFDRSPNFGSDQKNKWNFSGGKNRQKGNTTISISDYYHPSMVEDPWKQFEET